MAVDSDKRLTNSRQTLFHGLLTFYGFRWLPSSVRALWRLDVRFLPGSLQMFTQELERVQDELPRQGPVSCLGRSAATYHHLLKALNESAWDALYPSENKPANLDDELTDPKGAELYWKHAEEVLDRLSVVCSSFYAFRAEYELLGEGLKHETRLIKPNRDRDYWDEGYVPFGQLCLPVFKNRYKKARKFLRDHAIRTEKPRGQRLVVHAGDFHRVCAQLQANAKKHGFDEANEIPDELIEYWVGVGEAKAKAKAKLS